MKRRHEKKKLATVIIALSMLASCQNSDQQAEDREKFGIELYEKGEFAKAKLEFASALKGDGTLPETYYYLALLNEKEGNYAGMRENLIQTIKFNEKNIKARIKLGKLYLFFDELDAASTEAKKILNVSENNLDALVLEAAIYLKQDKQADAISILDNILQKQPDYAEAVSLKTLVLIQNKKSDAALNLINPLLNAGNDDISLHLLKIQIDSKQNNIEAVISDYEKISKLYPEKFEFKIALAKVYSQANREEDAERLLKKLVKSIPNEILPKLALLDFIHETSPEKINAQVETFSNQSSNQPKNLFLINQWLLEQNYLAESKYLLTKLDNRSTSDPKINLQAKLLLAALALNESEFDNALSIVNQITTTNPENIQVNIIKAKVLIAQEKFTKAESVLKKTLWAKPNSDIALTLLAQIELIKGNTETADKKFREAIESNPVNMEALIPVINRLLLNNETSYASDLLSRALTINPTNFDLIQRAVEIKAANGDWGGVDQLIESIEKTLDGSLFAKFLTAKIKQQQQDHPEAIVLFKEILNDAPNYPDVLRLMASSYEMTRKRTEMFSFISSFLEKEPNNIIAHLIMGQILVLDNKFEKAFKSYNNALVINDQQPQIYAALARAYNSNNQPEEAISIYKQGLEKIPNNVRLSIYLAAAYQQVKEYKNAESIYSSLLTLNSRLEIAINNYVSLLVDTYGDVQSIEKAVSLSERFKNSENPFYLDSYAWALLKSGNIKEAIPLLEKVNLIADKVAVFKYHLGVAFSKQNNKAAAIAQISQAITLGKTMGGFENSAEAAQLLAQLSMQKN